MVCVTAKTFSYSFSLWATVKDSFSTVRKHFAVSISVVQQVSDS